MLLALCDLYERLVREDNIRIAPPGYSMQKISFKVVLRPDGTLFDVQDVRTRDGVRRRPLQLIVPGGAKPRGAVTAESVASKVLPLRNDSAFLLGFAKPHPGDSILTPAEKGEFAAFREYHLAAEREVADAHFSTVCRFLENWDCASARDRSDWVDIIDGQGIFQLLGSEGFVHERPQVTAWWEGKALERVSPVLGQCLVTGQEGPLAKLHEPKLKAVQGANTAGAAIVSFNCGAFESYGRTQSFNAPVSQAAAFRYATALNALLDGPLKDTHRFQLGADTVVFWTDRPTRTEDIFARFCSFTAASGGRAPAEDEATRQKLELFLQSVRQGRSAYADLGDDPERTRFFLLALAGNAGRIAVRFLYDNTLARLLDRLRLHLSQCDVTTGRKAGETPDQARVPSLRDLLDQTCPRRNGRPDRDHIPPLLAAPLLQAVLTGSRYPLALYQAVLRRLQVEGVDHPRASILKGTLVRNFGREVSVSLDRDRGDPEYRLGRLFAALEKTQTDALGRDLNRTVREAFYGSASTAPATVFPRLLRTYQHHLSKLEGGLRVSRDRLVQEIVGPIRDFPPHLPLVAQGLFALGYYHQMKDFYTAKRAESESEAEGGEA